jgi:hypothetical protein
MVPLEAKKRLVDVTLDVIEEALWRCNSVVETNIDQGFRIVPN